MIDGQLYTEYPYFGVKTIEDRNYNPDRPRIKDILWKHYVEGLENSMKTVEDVMKKCKQNLTELTEKLKYIKKQHDNIQEG